MLTLLGRTIAAGLAALLGAAVALGAQQIDSSGVDLYESAEREARQGHFDAALALCDKTLVVEPDNFNALYLRGVVLAELDRAAEAERSLRRATEIEPEVAAPHAALGQVLLGLDRPADAEKELARALAIDPTLSAARANYAIALWRRQAFADADRELSQLEAEKRATPDSFVLHGQVLEQLGRAADAVAAYGRAIELDPKNADARVFRGRLRAQASDTMGAIEDLAAANAIHPDKDVENELVALREKAGDAAGAVDALRARVAADPKDVEARRALADALARTGQLDEAKTQVEALVAAAPRDPTVFDFAGDVVLDSAPLDAARYYLQAAKLAPDNVGYRLKLGSALVRAGRYQAALEHLRFAVERSPDLREAHSGLGAALYGSGDNVGAAREFQWLADREPDSPFVQFFLGASLDRVGDCRGALAAFERFVAHADAQRDKARLDEVTTLIIPRLRRQIDGGDCGKVDKTGKTRKGE